MICTHAYRSPLGGITLASDGENLTGLWFDGQKYFAAGLPPVREVRDLPVFAQTRAWLDAYFCGETPASMPPLALSGTPFRRAVWDLLRQIPYGQVTTYRDLAAALARQQGLTAMAAQAVGAAVGRNPVSLLVPCHRVVGSNGSLTGYAGGLDKKLWLLRREGVDTSGLFVPQDRPRTRRGASNR